MVNGWKRETGHLVPTNVINKLIKEEMRNQIAVVKSNLSNGLKIVKERPLDTYPANTIVSFDVLPKWLQDKYLQIKEEASKMNDKATGPSSAMISFDEVPADMTVNEDLLHKVTHPVEALMNDWKDAVGDVPTEKVVIPAITEPMEIKVDTVDPSGKEVLDSKTITMEPGKTYDVHGNEVDVGRGCTRPVIIEDVEKITADMIISENPDLTDEQQGLYRLILNKIDEDEHDYVLTWDDAKEILRTMKMLMTHCRIELLKDNLDLKKVIDLSEIAISMKESSKGFSDTAEAIEKLATGDIFGPALPGEDGEIVEEEHVLGDLASKTLNTGEVKLEDEDDIEQMCDNMLKDIDMAKKTFDVVYEWYMSSHKETTVYDDILEKLQKDVATIQATNDVNGPRKLKAIHEVIDSIESRDSKFLLESLYNKTENPKRLRELAKEFIRIGPKVYNKLHTIGFSKEDLQNFILFFTTETLFRNIYNTGETYLKIDPNRLKNVPKEAYPDWIMRELTSVCCFFFYHLLRICDAEKKREYYLTIKYRLGIILICDTNLKCPSQPKTFRSRFTEPITEEPLTETEVSLERSKLYDMYMPLIARYYDVMGDKTLFKYAGDQLRKKK